MKRDVVRGLRRVEELLEIGWTQGTYARTKSGGTVPYDHTRAVSWCLIGAALRAEDERTPPLVGRLVAILNDCVGRNPSAWNDHPLRKKEHVLHVVRMAIRSAKAAR